MAKQGFIKKQFKERPITSSLVTAALLFGVGWTFKRAWGGGNKYGRPPKIERDLEKLKNTWTPTPLAQKLFQQMDGVNFNPLFSGEAWKELYELPHDQQVVDVYESFNAMYYPKSGQTLTQWVRDESSDIYGNRDKALKRLESLHLAEAAAAQSIKDWIR